MERVIKREAKPPFILSAIGGISALGLQVNIGNTDPITYVNNHLSDLNKPIQFIGQSYGIYMFVNHSGGTQILYRLVVYNGNPGYCTRNNREWGNWHEF